ncbi:MAG: glycosyltransferase family 39 protein, partial [Chloroflexota bacterium]
MRLSKTQLGLVVALLVGNAIILYSDFRWVWLRFPAALALMFGLPGWAWLPPLGWLQTRRGLERMVLVVGLSSLLSATALFIALFVPGPFTETPALIALNLTILSGLVFQLGVFHLSRNEGRSWGDTPQAPRPAALFDSLEWPSRTVLLILLVILAVAAVTRLTRLGYAEFHEDELENMRLIIRAYKGEEYAPFLDSKGPIHWLLPAGLWYLNGWINEGIARTPMLITSLLLIPTMYVLGRRLSNERDSVGLAAAGLVALNGFYVAYARHVENQSLIVFWGALAMWLVYRYYGEDRPHFLIWVALALAVGLIAHPDVLLYLPVFGYVIWLKLWSDRPARRAHWPWLLVAGLLWGGLAGLFYIPYLTDPAINLVYQYFGEARVGTSLFYNRVANIFDQDQL